MPAVDNALNNFYIMVKKNIVCRHLNGSRANNVSYQAVKGILQLRELYFQTTNKAVAQYVKTELLKCVWEKRKMC